MIGLRRSAARLVLTLPTLGAVWSPLRTLERTQWLPAERLKDIQIRRLKLLLSHARRSVPYYRSLDANVFKVNNLDDLASFPILTRAQARQHFDDLQSLESAGGQITRSSGSMGRLVRVRKSPLTLRMESAAQYRSYRWVGFDFGDRYGYILPVYRSAWTQVRNPIADLLLPRTSMDAFNIDNAKLTRFVRVLQSKPTVLVANPSALLVLAKYVEENNIRPKVKLIISTSDQLLCDERRRLVSILGAKLYDFYGSNEIGSIAAECEESIGHHISSENVIVEIIGRDGTPVPAGQVGSVVLTDLNNFTMPLIRYEIGDMSSLLEDECPCGRGLPLLGPVEGRITDVLVTPDGRFMCLSTFYGRVLSNTHVEQFQIHQSSLREITVRAILRPEWRTVEADYIQRVVGEIVGDEVKVKVEFPEMLEVRGSGKRCLVKSDLLPRASERP